MVKRTDVSHTKPVNLDGDKEPRTFKDPFLPPFEPYLLIDSWSSKLYPERYSMVLNKFNVMKHHALIITKEFESQFTPLIAADLEVLYEVVHDIDALGFYNAGKEAGPSQPHRHLQSLKVVPREGNEMPFVDLLDKRIESVPDGGSLVVPEFSFKHSISKISKGEGLLEAYHECLRKSDIPVPQSEIEEVKAHNLLMGKCWMMVVPRSHADFEEISGNGLNFTGSFFVKSMSSLEKIERVGAWNILQFLGYPATNSKV